MSTVVEPLAHRLERLAEEFGELALGTAPACTAVVPAEAVLALEALATGIGHAGHHVLSIESSRYGALFSGWLRAAGATVTTITLSEGRPILAQDLREALASDPRISVVSITQAEIISANAQPMQDVIATAHAAGAAVVVDAVAAIGGLSAPLGADAVVVGAQKALDGPAELSFIAFSERGLTVIADDSDTESLLSVRALVAQQRAALAGTRAPLLSEPIIETAEHALADVRREGIDARIARHLRTRSAARAGLTAAGLSLLIEDEEAANSLATAAVLPQDVDVDAILSAPQLLDGAWVRAGSTTKGPVVRFSHYGVHAAFDHVLSSVVGLAHAVRRGDDSINVGAAAAAIAEAWYGPTSPQDAPTEEHTAR